MQIRMQDFGEINPGGVPNWMRGAQHARQGVKDTFNLITQALEQQKMREELPYAAAAKKAQISSQNAYANLMGPQFISKLMANPQILPNVPDDKKFALLNNIFSSVMGNQEGFQQLNSPSRPNMENKPVQEIQQEAPSLTERIRANLSSMRPGDSYTVPSPENYNPQQDQINRYQPEILEQPRKTWAENVAEQAGIESEGKEAGKIRAKDISELSDISNASSKTLDTLHEVSNLLNDPLMESIKQHPILGHHELSYYEKFGTPEQQQIAGRYRAATGQIIADFASNFKGAFRVGEQSLLNSMKANPNDSIDVAKGKTEALMGMVNFIKTRSEMISNLMEDRHISKNKASQIADKQLDGNSIRKAIKETMYPKNTYNKSGTTRVFYNGKAHLIPNDKVEEALAAGGSLNG
jgi:hypothetical protein